MSLDCLSADNPGTFVFSVECKWSGFYSRECRRYAAGSLKCGGNVTDLNRFFAEKDEE